MDFDTSQDLKSFPKKGYNYARVSLTLCPHPMPTEGKLQQSLNTSHSMYIMTIGHLVHCFIDYLALFMKSIRKKFFSFIVFPSI